MSERAIKPRPILPLPERSAPRALLSSYRPAVRLAGVLLALLLIAAAPAAAANVGVLAVSLEHQPASEALALVRTVLTPDGTVELQPGGNTLVIRDRQPVLDRVEVMLAQFDHPPQRMRFEIHLLRAGAGVAAADPMLPEPLLERLRAYLRYDTYERLGGTEVSGREGEPITYALGNGYSIRFRPGTVLAGQRLKLHGFQITRTPPLPAGARANKSRQPARELLRTNLNLWREKPFTVVLPQGGQGAQEALMVAITFRPEDAP